MLRSRSLRLTAAVVAMAGVIVLAGSAAIASNMGFKMNKALVIKAAAAPAASNIGRNFVSLPYNTPYTTIQSFCTATGLPNQTLIPARPGATVSWQENVAGNDIIRSGQCGNASANLLLPTATLTRFIDIVELSTALNPVTSIIIVGSHNPATAFTINSKPASPPAAPTDEDFWFSVPYHTTAVTAADLCVQFGLTTQSTIPPRVGAKVIRLTTDGQPSPPGVTAFSTHTCAVPATNYNLVLGEGVIIQQTVSPTNPTIPAHF